MATGRLTTLSVTPCSVMEVDKDVYACTDAPKPHPAFELYLPSHDDGLGVLKVRAIGKTLKNDSYGHQARAEIERIKDQLTAKYGEPTSHYGGSYSHDPQDWLLKIYQNEWVYDYYWFQHIGYKQVGNVYAIGLKVRAVNYSDSRIHLDFEYPNLEKYIERKRARESDAF